MDRENFTLSIVIPCYNEKNSIRTIVDKVLAAPIKNKEIVSVTIYEIHLPTFYMET